MQFSCCREKAKYYASINASVVRMIDKLEVFKVKYSYELFNESSWEEAFLDDDEIEIAHDSLEELESTIMDTLKGISSMIDRIDNEYDYEDCMQ